MTKLDSLRRTRHLDGGKVQSNAFPWWVVGNGDVPRSLSTAVFLYCLLLMKGFSGIEGKLFILSFAAWGCLLLSVQLLVLFLIFILREFFVCKFFCSFRKQITLFLFTHLFKWKCIFVYLSWPYVQKLYKYVIIT